MVYLPTPLGKKEEKEGGKKTLPYPDLVCVSEKVHLSRGWVRHDHTGRGGEKIIHVNLCVQEAETESDPPRGARIQ